MPFQMKFEKPMPEGFYPIGFSNGAAQAMAALPIFGGTAPTPDDSPSDDDSDSTSKTTKTESSADASGGESSNSAEALTPEQISDLLKQVTQLNSTVTQLKTENDSFKTKEDQARRASQGREQTLEEDNQRLTQTVDAMDQVIKHLAIVNAIQGNKDLRFHDPRDVIARLDHSSYNLDVDLDNGQATVKNIENELKRIASECPWLVVKPADSQNNNQSNRAPRGTGTPPASSAGNQTAKAQRRKDLEAKWPVIGSGRVPIPR